MTFKQLHDTFYKLNINNSNNNNNNNNNNNGLYIVT